MTFWPGFPIRTSRDRRLFTAPPGFSQCPTSFFGIQRQGILRKLLVAFYVMQGTGPSSGLYSLSRLLISQKIEILQCFLHLIWPTYCIRLSMFFRSSQTFLSQTFVCSRKLQVTFCGDEGTRTPGLCLAKAPLSQLSYIPMNCQTKVLTIQNQQKSSLAFFFR